MGVLSEESKQLLRDMIHSEAWRIYESIQQEQIRQLRVLATDTTTLMEKPNMALVYSADAQGRENALTSLKDMLYESTSGNG